MNTYRNISAITRCNNHYNGNIIDLEIIELGKLYREDLEKVLENLAKKSLELGE